MTSSRFILVLSIVVGVVAITTSLAPIPRANAKGKPSGGGGGNANFAFVFELNNEGLFLTTIDDSDRVRLTSPKGKSHHIEPRWSPDIDPDTPGYQGMIAYTELVDGVLNLYVVKPDGSGNRLVRASAGGETAWTPNGNEIVLAEANTRLIAIEVATGNRCVLWDDIDNVGPSVSGVAISPLGMLAFYKDSDVFVVDYSLGADGLIDVDPTSVVTLTEPESHDDAPSFSPDGTRLAYSRLDPIDGWQIVVLDFLTDQEMVVTEGLSGPRRVAWSPDGSQLAIDAKTTSSRGNSMDLFRITNWDDPANRQVIQVTDTDGLRKQEITPAWNPGWQKD